MIEPSEIEYKRNAPLVTADIIRVFEASGINRPTSNADRIASMFAHANLVISAWADYRLIGIARALTDFSYCCYLSDLAVDRTFQHQGIGRELIAKIRNALGEEVALILLSSPDAMEYYPKVGFAAIDNGYIIKRLR